MKKKIMYTYFTEDFGEVDAFFDEDFKLLTWWNLNDANYRSEYMDPLFEALGIDVQFLPKNKEKMAMKIIKKEMGE